MKRIKTPIIFLLCAVIALSACLAGCDKKEPHFPVALSDPSVSALKLNTNPYKDSDLNQIYQFMLDGGNVNKLNDKYEIKCLRKDEDGYRVIYWGNKSILALRFDTDGSWIKTDKLHTIYTLIDSRGKFDPLQVGDDVSKVQTADPSCYFPFLVDKTSTDLETRHYSADGYYTRIQYDEDFKITSVTSEVM